MPAGARGGQKRLLDSPEVGLQALESGHVGAEN